MFKRTAGPSILATILCWVDLLLQHQDHELVRKQCLFIPSSTYLHPKAGILC